MMNGSDQIDITFDFRTDTPPRKDPDADSPMLRRYHRILWSKPLPCCAQFELEDTYPQGYLYHKSAMGEFKLSSDSVIPTFRRQSKTASILKQFAKEELELFETITYTIGGMMIFPANRISGQMTINGARGFHPRIRDRFDLTVECIRRHYHGQSSPLYKALERYSEYFALFANFRGFVEFFLLQDVVVEDYSAVRFFAPFDNFKGSPIPSNAESYATYMHLATEFIKARNRRISTNK